ncbi:hypothetical protein B0H10DRAFT_1959264 [Mycena sp. CBHHK59/15]|nr:hypothetical protein B0H10DRAFT_1959264 [Mycena sp. CBHHK59/15]
MIWTGDVPKISRRRQGGVVAREDREWAICGVMVNATKSLANGSPERYPIPMTRERVVRQQPHAAEWSGRVYMFSTALSHEAVICVDNPPPQTKISQAVHRKKGNDTIILQMAKRPELDDKTVGMGSKNEGIHECHRNPYPWSQGCDGAIDVARHAFQNASHLNASLLRLVMLFKMPAI